MSDRDNRQWFQLRERYCQFCCTIIGRWASFFGVVNCKQCSHRMQYGGHPRCWQDAPAGCHFHGRFLR